MAFIHNRNRADRSARVAPDRNMDMREVRIEIETTDKIDPNELTKFMGKGISSEDFRIHCSYQEKDGKSLFTFIARSGSNESVNIYGDRILDFIDGQINKNLNQPISKIFETVKETFKNAIDDKRELESILQNETYAKGINYICDELEKMRQFLPKQQEYLHEWDDGDSVDKLIDNTSAYLDATRNINIPQDVIKKIAELNRLREEQNIDNKVLKHWLEQCKNTAVTFLSDANILINVNSAVTDIKEMTAGKADSNKWDDLLSQLALKISNESDRKKQLNIFYTIKSLHSILQCLKGKDLLNSENIKYLMNYINNNKDDMSGAIFLLKQKISKLSRLNLLVDSNYKSIMEGTYVDKSCSARTAATGYQFFGTSDDYEKKVMWSYYCVGAESRLTKMINSNLSLNEIYGTACKMRYDIAVLRNEVSIGGGIAFGNRRTEEITDTYAKIEDANTTSIVDENTYASIQTAAEPLIQQAMQLPEVQVKLRDANGGPFEFEIKRQLTFQTSDGKSIALPECTMTVMMDKGQAQHIKIDFSPPKQGNFNALMNEMEEHFDAMRKNFRFSENKDAEFLLELGKLAFYLSRSYNLERGNGAIVQWILRSITKNYSNADLGDIRINGVPYDIYAQLTDDPNKYPVAFKDSLIGQFLAYRESHLNAAKMHDVSNDTLSQTGAITASAGSTQPTMAAAPSDASSWPQGKAHSDNISFSNQGTNLFASRNTNQTDSNKNDDKSSLSDSDKAPSKQPGRK